jgi:alpha-galactosidase
VSQIDYYLGGRCSQVTAVVGVDDAVKFDPQGGTVVFQVSGDGKKLYDSGIVNRTATRNISVDTTGANVLTLSVGDAGDGGYNDRADWANLQVTCTS